MSSIKNIILALTILIVTSLLFTSSLTYQPTEAKNSQFYQYQALHNKDGIGKYYLGREIAKVMGHREFLWLERPNRENQEKPSAVISALNLKPTDTIADIGAGSGYFSFRLAQKVPQGKVFAVDIQPEMLDIIKFLSEENPQLPVIPVLGTKTSPNLEKESINLALMVDAYHEFTHPREMMEEIVTALRPQGRVILVEYRKENPFIFIKGVHKMSVTQVKKEMEAVGLSWVTTEEFLPQQHYIVFEKT
ncbi:methyltransferase domain-containing protein [Cyanobacterium stanieri LEGE 03274]|uniref:Methyltransferase domain-containing protein n=1 Tax=Cyanobacterium stanieri LEGE 03274 TaxID=1828756 RepID=A0ABR9V0J3_9CHRO|nr:methyltransferase domain-containing protein [Cyanobacterium stanieri]MBE9221362.1 methyltransferase domain-containing protein [Cyanobacterium stanieri LEGE 03274]